MQVQVDGRGPREILAKMRRIAVHATALALLGLIAVAAGAGVAKAASALEHACCPKAASSEAGDDSPCHGFLPLSCCNAAALPATAPAALDPTVHVALPIAPVAMQAPADRAAHPARVDFSPRTVPLLRSVVLQL